METPYVELDEKVFSRLTQRPGQWNAWRGGQVGRLVLVGGNRSFVSPEVAAELFTDDSRLTSAEPSEAFDFGSMEWLDCRVDGHLTRAKWSDSLLTSVDLLKCNLDSAIFERAEISECNFWGSRFVDASFEGAEIAGTRFTGGVFWGTRWHGCLLSRVGFFECDLAHCDGLDQVRFAGRCAFDAPSMESALRAPGGAGFLERAGYPRELVAYLPDSFEAAIGAVRWQSCFLSHSEIDNAFCEPLYQRLNAAGVQTWYSPHSMKWGEPMYPQIQAAIGAHDRLLVVLSKDSMASSWVAEELKKARRKEKESGRRVLFPISLVPYEAVRAWELPVAVLGENLADVVKEYYIPCVASWQSDPDLFEREFAKLLDALKEDDRE